jgi:hypothetical protein
MVDELVGANPAELENKVMRHKVDAAVPFAGKGFTLAGSSDPANEMSLRDARLKAYGATVSAKPSAPITTTPQSTSPFVAMEVSTEQDPELAEALRLSCQPSTKPTTAANANAAAAAAAATAAVEKDRIETEEAEAEQRLEDQKWDEEMVTHLITWS